MAQKRWLREQIPLAVRRGRAEVSRTWRRHRGALRFVEKHYPWKFERIRTCMADYTWKQSVQDPRLHKPVAKGCGQDPWCIVCAKRKTLYRTMEAFNKFHKATPGGKQPRFYHMVQTAPLTRSGEGWGKQASQDIGSFFRVVWDAIEDEYGRGVGGVLSYQDFGEEGFAKRHPHIDFTLNGWMLQDGEAVGVPRLDLAGKGRRRWDDLVRRHAMRLAVDARRGNFDAQGPWTGIQAYFKVLRYQVRELVDFRKIHYARDADHLYWESYRDNRRTKIPVVDFKAAMGEYEIRLGRWRNDVGAKNLHRQFGTMADRKLNATMHAMDGRERPHRRNCPCSQCGDWIDIELSPEEEAKIRPWRLKAAHR